MATRLLAIADPGCSASTRYRVTQYESDLQSKGVELQILEWPANKNGEALDNLMNQVAQADAVVFQRYLPDSATLRQIRGRARRLSYDFDDAVLYSESTRGNPHLKLRRSWRFRQMMRCCDAVTAGNDYLAALARRYAAAGRVHTVPTTLDLRKYRCEATPAELSPASSPVTGPIIGWIGSRSTLPYLEKLRLPLEQLSQEFPGLTVRVIADQRPDLGKTEVELVPWDARSEVMELKRLRVGLAPLPDDNWTRGKCGLRLLQYLAAGIPAVASPVGTQAAVTEAGAGLAANSDAEWVQAISRILSDESVAATLTSRGEQLLREGFDAQVWAEPLHTIWCGGN